MPPVGAAGGCWRGGQAGVGGRAGVLAGGGFVGTDLLTHALVVALLVGAAEPLPSPGAQVAGAAGLGRGCGSGAKRAGGLLRPAGDQTGGGLVGAEVGEVVGGQLWGDVAL